MGTKKAPSGAPTREELEAARDKTVADVIAKDLRVLFVGINPGLYTAAIGHHFGRPGNRFWPALHRSGFTPRQLSPYDEDELRDLGIGVTNLVARATAAAAELSSGEIAEGGRILREKVRRYRPQVVAFLGMEAYKTAFGVKSVRVGEQDTGLEGARVWVLPNPSGLNANYQLDDFVRLVRELREAL